MELGKIKRFFNRLYKLVEILFLTVFDIIRLIFFPLTFTARMIVNLLIPGEDFRWIEDRFRDIQKDINRLEIDRVNNKDWFVNNQNITGHKHDNYQSQIDMINRRLSSLNTITLNPDTVTERLDKLGDELRNLHSLHRKFKNEVELSLESMNNKIIDLGDFNLINTEDETEELSQIEAEIKGETIVKQLKDDSDVQRFMRQQEIDFHRETNLVTDKIEKQAEIDYVSGIDD